MADVFISHSGRDTALAVRLAEDLRALGHEPWVYEEDPSSGSLVKFINDALTKSTAFLFLLSASALSSTWVEDEWQAAYNRSKKDASYQFLICSLDASPAPALIDHHKRIDLMTDAAYEAAVAAIHAELAPPAKTAPANPIVWYFDDEQESRDAFAARHADRFRVSTFSEIVDLLSALARASSDPDTAPDALLLDLYCPREGADPEAVAAAERGLDEFVEAEEELRRYVDAAWHPLGVDIVQSVRQHYSPQQLPIIMHTQEGLFLLRDELVEELEEMGAGWLLKGRFSAATDRLVMERLVMRSGHKFGPGRPRILIIDDNQKYIDSFIERQSEHFEIEQIHSEDEVLRTLTRLEAEDRFPDVFVVDMYYPRGSDPEAVERINVANQKLREFAEIEQALRRSIQESFEPLGLTALKQLRRVYKAEQVTAIVYAQSGMLLLNDQNMQEIEKLGGRWLLKDRYDARTEQTMILGELMQSGNVSW